VLTGTYNFSATAARFGHMTIAERLREARACAALFGKEFAEGLERGVAIAWQEHGSYQGRLGAVEQRRREYPTL
jgi:monoamine oxidase